MHQKALCLAARLALLLALSPVAAHAGVEYRVLHNFDYGENYQIGSPSGALAIDPLGNLFGATGAGGIGCDPFGCGVIFEFNPKGGSLAYEFTGGAGGSYPQQILFDSAGNLYGNVGDSGNGVAGVYELAIQSGQWNFNMLYTQGGCCLVFDKKGDLYGGLGPGDYKAGAIAELSPGPNGWTYTQLYSFCGSVGCTDGEEPRSALSWDSKGNLYGTTLYGGVSVLPCPGSLGCGVAFQMTPNGDGTWTYHVMDRFASYKGDGLYPYAGLTLDAFGNAYGATASGGTYGNGTIFKLSPSAGGWKKTVLYEFPNCAEGCVPSYTLVFDKAGNLYGSGGGGNPECGSYTCGTIFRLIPRAGGKWKYQAVYKFSGTDGAFPYGVVLDNRGHMFGTTSGGGTYNAGVLFEITQ
jgi:uncharacterized repeat protein (TIGR03803 family)